MDFINETLKKCSQERMKLSARWDATRAKLDSANIFNRAKLEKESEEAFKKLLDYSRNTYAKAIFETLSKNKPNLVRVRTGEKCSWGDLFSTDFESLDAKHRDILVGLIDGGGYKLAD